MSTVWIILNEAVYRMLRSSRVRGGEEFLGY